MDECKDERGRRSVTVLAEGDQTPTRRGAREMLASAMTEKRKRRRREE